MKPNPHFLSVLNEKLAKQEKKQNQDIQFLKDMGCRENLSDRECSEVWSVLQDVLEGVESRVIQEIKIKCKEVSPVKTPPNKYDRSMTWRYCALI
jgi:hypothetical protein